MEWMLQVFSETQSTFPFPTLSSLGYLLYEDPESSE